jgi:hypothetical protein
VNNFLKLIQALYAISVRFYPREYRLEFEDELRSVFGALAQDAASQGPAALASFCLRELRDYPISLLQTHLEKNRMSAFFRSEPVRFTLRGVFAFVVLFVAYNVVFDLVIGEMQVFFLNFFAFHFSTFDNIFIALFAWLIATASAGTLFAVILGQRARLRWLVLLVSAASLPWFLPYALLQVFNGGSNVFPYDPFFVNYYPEAGQSLVWIRVVSLSLLVAAGIFMLSREQARFRWLVVAGMLAWLPLLVVNILFYLRESQVAPVPEQVVQDALLGAFLAGIFGFLLKDRRKILWLIIVGAILYPVTMYIHWPIYNWLLAPFFPMQEFTTLQWVARSGLFSAVDGLVFGLPLVLLLLWLGKNNFPHFPAQEIKETA